MKRMNNVSKVPVLIIYVIVFYSVWTVWEFWIRTFISNSFGNECISQLIKSGIIKNLVWTFPAILQNGGVEIVRDFGIDKIVIVLFVGLTEEMVFRGWLLNATIHENRKWFYIIINAAMFLVIHFPIWIYSGNFISYFTSLQFIEVMALSVIFSITFIKSRSILVPVTLHMYFDLLVFMFI